MSVLSWVAIIVVTIFVILILIKVATSNNSSSLDSRMSGVGSRFWSVCKKIVGAGC